MKRSFSASTFAGTTRGVVFRRLTLGSELRTAGAGFLRGLGKRRVSLIETHAPCGRLP